MYYSMELTLCLMQAYVLLSERSTIYFDKRELMEMIWVLMLIIV
jgi:hypothetical protein